MRLVAPFLACVVASLALAACGGGDNASPTPTPVATQTSTPSAATPQSSPSGAASAPTPTASPGGVPGPLDVCALITDTEMVAIVGPVNPGLRNSISPNEYACEWTSAPGSQVAVGLGVHLNTAAGEQAELQADPGVSEPGLGDGAKWDAASSTLHVAEGGYLLDISPLDLSSADASLTAAKSIAQTALPRLP